jgi:hypothetical protein
VARCCLLAATGDHSGCTRTLGCCTSRHWCRHPGSRDSALRPPLQQAPASTFGRCARRRSREAAGRETGVVPGSDVGSDVGSDAVSDAVVSVTESVTESGAASCCRCPPSSPSSPGCDCGAVVKPWRRCRSSQLSSSDATC